MSSLCSFYCLRERFSVCVCVHMLWMLGLAVSGRMSPSVALHRVSLRQVLSLMLALTDWLGRLSSESQGSLSLSLSILELQTWASMFGFYMRGGDLNPGPHVWAASS